MAKRKKGKPGTKGKKFPIGRAILWLVLVLETIWLWAFIYSTGSPIPSAYTDWRDENAMKKEIFGVGVGDGMEIEK